MPTHAHVVSLFALCLALFTSRAHCSLSWSSGQKINSIGQSTTVMYPSEYSMSSSLGDNPELLAEIGWRSGEAGAELSVFAIALKEYERGEKTSQGFMNHINAFLCNKRRELITEDRRIELITDILLQQKNTAAFQAAYFFDYNYVLTTPQSMEALAALKLAMKRQQIINLSPTKEYQNKIIINGNHELIKNIQKKFDLSMYRREEGTSCIIINHTARNSFIIGYKGSEDDMSKFVNRNNIDLLSIDAEELKNINFIMFATPAFWQCCKHNKKTDEDLRDFMYNEFNNQRGFSVAEELINFVARDCNEPMHVTVIYPNTKTASEGASPR